MAQMIHERFTTANQSDDVTYDKIYHLELSYSMRADGCLYRNLIFEQILLNAIAFTFSSIHIRIVT